MSHQTLSLVWTFNNSIGLVHLEVKEKLQSLKKDLKNKQQIPHFTHYCNGFKKKTDCQIPGVNSGKNDNYIPMIKKNKHQDMNWISWISPRTEHYCSIHSFRS